MKKVFEYSHLGGLEILKLRYPKIDQMIDEIIYSVDITKPTKISKEKNKIGKKLFSPSLMNKLFKHEFKKRGFVELRDKYKILTFDGVQTINSYKQIDFVKEKVLVEVQFGKYAFMFYDLAKFQFFYNREKADVGVEIVPSYYLHTNMSTGVSYGEQLIYDIKRLERNFPSVPVKIILVDID